MAPLPDLARKILQTLREQRPRAITAQKIATAVDTDWNTARQVLTTLKKRRVVRRDNRGRWYAA